MVKKRISLSDINSNWYYKYISFSVDTTKIFWLCDKIIEKYIGSMSHGVFIDENFSGEYFIRS